jgi:hypothetical protein
MNDSLYKKKTYNNYEKKPSKRSKYVYQKSKTPCKTCIFYNKKTKSEYNYNNEMPSSNYSESNNTLNNSNYGYKIDESLCNRYNNIKYLMDSKKLNMLMKNGIQFDLNENKDNDYIDLLTISDIQELEKRNKLRSINDSTPKKDRRNISNYILAPHHYITSSTNTNNNSNEDSIDNYSYNLNKTYDQKRNNKFLRSNYTDYNINSNIIKNNGKRKRNKLYEKNKRDCNKSYDCIVFKKKIGIKKKKKGINNKKIRTPDVYRKKTDKGTPIKKEDDKGGKVVLLKNIMKGNNYKNAKKSKLGEEEKMSNSYYDDSYNVEEETVTKTVIIIQKWWKKITYKRYIKKIIIIQKIYRGYKYRRNNGKKIKNRINN